MDDKILKVYEPTSEVYQSDGKWVLDCRVMRPGADDFDTEKFTFSTVEHATDFFNTVSDIEAVMESYMQELATELFQIQTMLNDGEPYIVLETVDEDYEADNPVPRLVH